MSCRGLGKARSGPKERDGALAEKGRRCRETPMSLLEEMSTIAIGRGQGLGLPWQFGERGEKGV